MRDEARFRALFSKTYPSVVRYAYNCGHRGPDAEDLVSATFEVAWRRLDDVPDGEGATPWLLAVARNLSRNAGRRARRQRGLIDPVAAPEEVAASGGVAEDAAAREQILTALSALKEIDRELILLVARDGLDPTQAGEVLGLRSGAARSRLRRARNQLAGLLGVETVSRRPAMTDVAGKAAKEEPE
jgi:RNA polymerase sigma factor (sigma-70 family)